MINIKNKSRIKVHWNVSPYDYSKEKVNSILSKFSHKYNLPKEKIKVIPEFIVVDENGDKIPLSEEEYKDFMENNPEINDMIKNKNILKNLVNEIEDD